MDLLDNFDLGNGENPQILTYGLDDTEIGILEDYMIHFDIQDLTLLDNFLLDHSLAEIIDGEGIEKVDVNSVEGKFVLFYDCSDATVNQFLDGFAELEMERPIFAIINEDNIDWNIGDLLETLLAEKEEHEYFDFEDEEEEEEEYEEDSFETAYGFGIEVEEEDDEDYDE